MHAGNMKKKIKLDILRVPKQYSSNLVHTALFTHNTLAYPQQNTY